jgi:CubicO group peptidase (beta-lactamase class C family)
MRVASISKLVTSIAVMKLLDDGRLALDRDVSGYLGFSLRNPAFPDTPITLRQLMSHRSSLRDGETYWAPWPQTLAELMQQAEHFDPGRPPGTYFTYSNLGFGIVGAIVECVTGERFDRYMRRTLFEPLGVEAGYNWSGLETLAPDRVTTLYRKQDGEDGPWDSQGPWIAQVDDFEGRSPAPVVRVAQGSGPPPGDYRVCSNGTLFSPHGGLRISTRDLARVVAASLKDGTLARLARHEWHVNAARSNGETENGLYQGFGLGVHRDMAGTKYVGHFADAYGLKGGVLVDLRRERGWIYLLTGTARAPVLAKPPRSGVDTSEAAAIDALLASQ